MKKLLTLLIAVLITACSTSSQVDNPNRIGTWRIDSPEHATWMGSQGSAMEAAYNVVAADSTSPDTTYFFSNDSLQAEITELSRDVYEGDFEFKITDLTLNDDILYDTLNIGGFALLNLGDEFQVEGFNGTTSYPDKTVLKIQTSFNCNDVDDNTGNFRIAFVEHQPDTVTTPPDTSMVYELSSQGLYSTVQHIVCQN